jgi:acyl-coenzyme A synthetase/AMP-(fatty) acid ligase
LHSDDSGPVGVALEGHDIAGLTYTSGTTSAQPRALLLPHRDHVQSFDPDRPRDYEKSKFFTGPFPIGTPSSQNIVISAVTGVPTVVFLTSVDPEFVCRVIAARGIDNIMLTPTMAADIVNSGAAERHDTSSVREISTGAAPITTTMLERVARTFPNAKITQFYVSSETVPGLTMMVFDPKRPGAVGKPMGETQIAIRDESGADLPPGELGQICLNHPRKSRRHLIPSSNDKDGWIFTGDLGHVDQDGYLHFFDRVADAVHCGTKLISTLHVENVLQQHPDVLDACVVGVPHPETGQAVAAAVVLKAEGSANDVMRFARERLEPQAVPCKVLAEQYLPRGIIGKPLKREVRAWFDPSSGQAALASHRKRDRCYW